MSADVQQPRDNGQRHRSLEQLLAQPPDDVDMKTARLTATYENKDAPFRIGTRTYERQYAQLYFARLMVMGRVMKQRVAKAWPGMEVVKILEVGRREGTQVVVIGTLYKEQKLKPSILEEYTKDRGLRAALGATSFCSGDDTLVLEDEGARMALRGAVLPVQQLVTGVVIAVKGVHEPGGDFSVTELLLPGMAPQVPRPVVEADKHVAFISGLKLTKNNNDMHKLHLAMELLSGALGGGDEVALAASVVRLVIAGGSVGSLDLIAQANTFSSRQQLEIQPIKDLDEYVAQMTLSFPVDVMPGAEDPTNVALPQQPLHRCLFPVTGSSAELVRATNPHIFEVDGVHLLGTSGQPIEDIAKYSQHADRLAILESCLNWRHMAPTAPDTLTSYPFHDSDPFIMESTPHVFFAGNQPEFATRIAKGPDGQEVRLVCVPNFSRAGCVVLLNLRTLECKPLWFESRVGQQKAVAMQE